METEKTAFKGREALLRRYFENEDFEAFFSPNHCAMIQEYLFTDDKGGQIVQCAFRIEPDDMSLENQLMMIQGQDDPHYPDIVSGQHTYRIYCTHNYPKVLGEISLCNIVKREKENESMY